jgi:hypothetical protein
LKHIQ